MFSGLEEKQLKGALEALLFVTDEPVGTITLADMVEVEPSAVEYALVDLRAQLEEENRGIQLREVAGGWRLFTHPAYHELIERYVVSWDTRKLSQAALETLAIIAYSQPVTRLGVASVRGVNSDSPINSLVEKGLVREAGNDDSPGNPALFATTKAFLEKFGLRSVEDLPDIESFAPDDELRAFISERLSATRGGAPLASGSGEGTQGQEGALALEGQEGQASLSFDEEGAIEFEVQGLGGDSPTISFSLADAEAEEGAGIGLEQLSAAFAEGFGFVEKVDLDGLGLEEQD